jgi:hypothetical protein
VNIRLHPQVLADPLDRPDPQRQGMPNRREPASLEHRRRIHAADQLRRQVQDDRVDDTVLDGLPP